MRAWNVAQHVRGHVPGPVRAAYRRVRRLFERAQTSPDRQSVPSTLVRVAERAGIKLNKPNRVFLRELHRYCSKGQPTVAILVGRQPSRLADVISEAYLDARVRRYHTGVSDSHLHSSMSADGPFDVIVDDTRRSAGRAARLRTLFFHVKRGGVYLVRNVRADRKPGIPDDNVLRLLSRLIAIKAQGGTRSKGQRQNDARSLASAIGRVSLESEHLLLTSRVTALAKMREDEMNKVIGLRDGKAARILQTRPAIEFESRCVLRENRAVRGVGMYEIYRAPEMSLREYHDVLCSPGQVAIQGNLLLPDTYRHNARRRLINRYTEELSPRFAKPLGDVSQAESLPGAYFYLDSTFRGHFGHAMTEQLSRLWAWPDGKRAEPGLKALMAVNKGRELASWEFALFRAAGIDPSDIVFVREPVRVERLLSATPMLSMPSYVHPDIEETWGRVGHELAALAPDRVYPTKIFCSRRTEKRACHNAVEVESFYASHGFEVIYPEDYPLPEQSQIFRRAEVVSGFAGSGLFSLAFCSSPKRVVMISSDSYTATNEYLIASVLGHEIDFVTSRADFARPEKGWDKDAYQSTFTFDFDREGVYLKDILVSI